MGWGKKKKKDDLDMRRPHIIAHGVIDPLDFWKYKRAERKATKKGL